ncbi:hypothetical protein [Candidatus Electrothrix sp.]|uniref:hypothetical protein n=1 Tax=Candidatus Electrothrix sp. TaxID=2170559 RepID=UPI004056EFFE
MELLNAIGFFMPFVLLLLWYLFGMYSDTANNHGRFVAFLLPLTPLIFIVMYTLLGISKILVYPFFVIFRKEEKYNNIVYLIKNPWLWSVKGLHEKVNKDQN